MVLKERKRKRKTKTRTHTQKHEKEETRIIRWDALESPREVRSFVETIADKIREMVKEKGWTVKIRSDVRHFLFAGSKIELVKKIDGEKTRFHIWVHPLLSWGGVFGIEISFITNGNLFKRQYIHSMPVKEFMKELEKLFKKHLLKALKKGEEMVRRRIKNMRATRRLAEKILKEAEEIARLRLEESMHKGT